MKSGKNALELFNEVKRQAQAKQDFLAPTSKLKMVVVNRAHIVGDKEVEGEFPQIEIDKQGYFDVKETGHEHISLHTGIHKKYYDKMLYEAPELLTQNVNHWFNAKPENRMVRTLDNGVRAMLSPGYRLLDNFDLSNVIFNEFTQYQGDLVLASSEITERRLYMKFVMPGMQKPVRVGDLHSAGVIISNSEIGNGRVVIDPFIYRLRCTNGMISSQAGLRKNHVGKRLDEFEEAARYFADETRKADDRAFFMKVRDVFRATLSGEIFEEQIALLQDATEKEITGNIQGAVQVVSNKFLFTEDESSKVLEHLMREGDYTKFGIANAITRSAEDLTSYDRATTFEKVGGEVIVMPQNEWRAIAEAKEPTEKKRRGRKPLLQMSA